MRVPPTRASLLAPGQPIQSASSVVDTSEQTQASPVPITESVLPQWPARKSGYLPSLDGWRALAIIGVLMTHDSPWSLWGHSTAKFKGYGGYGVYLFFAISGFLICTRILEEEAALGFFHLKSFYIRRLFRIQPAALAYLAVIAVLTLFGIAHESRHYWLGSLFLYHNFLWDDRDFSGNNAFTGHFWTLAVEEHFYILLSLVLFFVRRRRLAAFVAIFAAIYVGQRLGAAHGLYNVHTSSRDTQWVIQYLVFASMCALLLRISSVESLVVRLLYPWVAFTLTLAAMLLHRHHFHAGHVWSYAILLTEQKALFYGFSLWIIATIFHPSSLTTRFLEWKPMRFLGRISYSVYLWHVIFFIALATPVRMKWPPLLLLAQRPYKYIATLICALLSYYLLEKPMIRLGHKLAPPVTPGHRDLGPTKSEKKQLPQSVTRTGAA